MAGKATFTPGDYRSLAAKLDRFGAELTDGERTIMTTLFAAGASAIAASDGQDEVEGYLLIPAVQKVRESAARMLPGMSLGDSFLSVMAVNPPGGPPEPGR